MKTEKIAVAALVIIIVGALSVYLITAYYPDIIENLFEEEATIEIGNLADVNYIGKYASNNTVFDSSYEFPDNKTGGSPLKIFVSLNDTGMPPEGYETYSSDMIEGFMEGLIGLKEGQTATIGPIPPEKAYGANKLEMGDTFSTSFITASNLNNQLNQTLEVIGLDDANMTLKWIDVEDPGNFTMPEGFLMEDLENAYFTIYENLPPYYLWENSSKIVNITDEAVIVTTTPTKTESLAEDITFLSVGTKIGVVFPNITTATWNETSITITSSPTVGHNYTSDYFGTSLSIIINDVTDTHINTTIEIEGQNQTYEFNRTIQFNRTYSMRRTYTIPMTYQMLFAEDIEEAGYTLHELAGEELIFEVTIEKVYKAS